MPNLILSHDVAAVVDHIAALFRPRRIILFGSHASGQADASSDVDLLVVTETGGRPLRRAAEIYKTLDHQVPVDILVRSPEQAADPNPRDIILRTILLEGRTVYEAGD